MQTEHLGWHTDDFLIVGQNGAGARRKLAGQVKRTFRVSAANEECRKAIGDFWRDFTGDGLFSAATDRFTLVTLRGTDNLPIHRRFCSRTSTSTFARGFGTVPWEGRCLCDDLQRRVLGRWVPPASGSMGVLPQRAGEAPNTVRRLRELSDARRGSQRRSPRPRLRWPRRSSDAKTSHRAKPSRFKAPARTPRSTHPGGRSGRGGRRCERSQRRLGPSGRCRLRARVGRARRRRGSTSRAPPSTLRCGNRPHPRGRVRLQGGACVPSPPASSKGRAVPGPRGWSSTGARR